MTLTYLGHLREVNHSCKVPVLSLVKSNLWQLLRCLLLLKLQRDCSEPLHQRTAKQGHEQAPCSCIFSLAKVKPLQLYNSLWWQQAVRRAFDQTTMEISLAFPWTTSTLELQDVGWVPWLFLISCEHLAGMGLSNTWTKALRYLVDNDWISLPKLSNNIPARDIYEPQCEIK